MFDGQNLMGWLMAMILYWNYLVSIGCYYDYKTFTWKCPERREVCKCD